MNSNLIQINFNQGNNAKSMNAHDIYFPLHLFYTLRKLLTKNHITL
jgi:hypothetical protein